MQHWLNDHSSEVGTGIGASIGFIKAVTFMFVGIIGIHPIVDTIILSFLGGIAGYIGTHLMKWLHGKIKKFTDEGNSKSDEEAKH